MDILEILIGADLKEDAISDIQSKIDRLIASYSGKEIEIKLTSKDIDDAVTLTKTINNLKQKHAEEEKKIANEKANEEKRLAQEKAKEEKRLALEKAKEEKRIADEKAKEEKRLALEKAKEEKRLAQEKEKEEKRIEQEKKKREQEKAQEDKKRAQEEKKIQQEKEREEKRIAQEKAKEEKRLAQEQKKIQQEKEREEKRIAQEKAKEEKRIAQEKAKEEKRIALEKAKEEKRLAQEEKKREQEKAKEVKPLVDQRQATKEVYGESQKNLKDQQKEIKALGTGYGEIDKISESINKKGQSNLKIQKDINKYASQITKFQEGEQAGYTTNINQSGLKKEVDGFKEAYQEFKGKLGADEKKRLKEFVSTYRNLNVHQEDLNDRLKRADTYRQNLVNKANALEKIEKERIATQKKITDLEGKANAKEYTEEINRAKANLQNLMQVENLWNKKDFGKERLDFLAEANERTETLKRSMEELSKAEKQSTTRFKYGDKVNMGEVKGVDRGQELANITKIADPIEQENAMRKFVAEVLKAEHGVRGLSEENVKLKKTFDSQNNAVYRAITSYERADGELREYIHTIDTANNQMHRFSDNVTRTGTTAFDSLSRAFKRVPIWMTAMGTIYGSIHQIQQGLQSIYEIDKAMTNLNKVTEASEHQLDAFMGTANELGQQMGMLTKDVIDATTEFQRLGYNLEQSTALAEQALVYANVGDMGVVEAQQNLLSALRGFGVGQEQVVTMSSKYVDIFNEVGNNFAISSAGIGEALKRSSAILNVAGNSVEESVGLIVSANASIQDPKKVGNALTYSAFMQ